MDIYTYLGHTKADLEAITQDLTRYYITYKIRKHSGKSRRIDAPQEPLKSIQKDVMERVLYIYKAHPLAHGFVKDKSPATNAAAHVGKKYLVTMDIKDFFHSISELTVTRCLDWLLKQQTRFTYDATDTELLAKIMCYNGGLPQGSPTSPVMSNLVCLALDKKLEDFAQSQKAVVTRYADDIALSSDDPTIVKNYKTVLSMILHYGLKPNKRKTKIRKYFQRQQVTGVVVNEKLGVSKEKWRNMRAKLHNLIRDGKTISLSEYQQIRGFLEWIRSLNPTRGNQLIQQLSLIKVV